ncbi:FtsW/RodA/SpoVE family cell cycle protein [Carnobacteriaceae bacterium zg-ZUI240]|nr:FtsW/RodA/SpoVE family cell cycle protein [Carnobacteriaceae bacterium zg-ZUI240]
MKTTKNDRLFELTVMIIAVILSVIGIISVYSAGSYQVTDTTAPVNYMLRQLLFFIMSLVVCVITLKLKYKFFVDYKLIKYVVTFMLVLLVILFALPATKGAKAWINLGFIAIQPAEFAKIVLIWVTSLYFSKTRYLPNLEASEQDNAIQFLWAKHHQEAFPFLTYFMILLLVMLQPDTGGAMIMFLIITLMWLASGLFNLKTALKMLGIGVGSLITLAVLAILILGVDDYRSVRLLSFINPFAPANLDKTYQIRHSFYALANGGLFGVGIGNSVQKTGYLPENRTDFILSIIGEELGFFGVMLVIGLLMTLVFLIIRRSFMLRDTFNRFMLLGIALLFMIQTIFNVAGITSLLPLTGVTLPFISYGGSSMLSSFILIGLVIKFSIVDRQMYPPNN